MKIIHIYLQTFGYISALFSIFLFVVVMVNFAEPIYVIAENNSLTIEVQTNLGEVLPPGFDLEFNVTVRVKEDLQCTRKTFGM